MPLVYPWTTTITMLILLRVIHGSATAFFGPTASAALSDIVPPRERGRWLGIYAAIQGSGQAAGPVVAGWLLGRAGFALTFFVAAAFGGVACALLASWNASSSRRVPLAGLTSSCRFAK